MPNSTPSAKPQLQLSPTATRLLVVAVYALLGIATLLAVVAFFKHASALLLPMAVCFILICVPWTMLRMSINSGECPILCVRGFGLQVVRESVGVSHG